MGELAIILIDLVATGSWDDLDPEERRAFDLWLEGQTTPATGRDLYMLLHEARRRWRRVRSSSSTTLAAVRDLTRGDDS